MTNDNFLTTQVEQYTENSPEDKNEIRDTVRDSHSLNVQVRIAELSCAYLAALGLGLSILCYEYELSDTDDKSFEIILLVFNMLITLMLVLSIYFRYDIIIRWR
jgi:hypothetical protein